MNVRAALCALLLAACSGAPDAPPRPRLVVLYATCSLDKGFLSPYGAPAALTPNLAALAADSVVFERHVTESGVSGIAYASLFTGTQADRHGVYHHPSRLDDRLTTVFEAFAAAGYETHYFNGHKMASAELNYAQGVPPERVYPSQRDKRRVLTQDDAEFRILLERLAAEPALHALVVVNFTVTHAAYTAQLDVDEFASFVARHPDLALGATRADFERLGALYEAHRLPLQWDYPNTIARLGVTPEDEQRLARLLQATYAADVEILDRIVGGALAALTAHGLDGETLFCFTADHGEYLFQRERPFQWGHGLQLAPEELGVPWILRPARDSGFAPGRHAGVTRSIDVFPTLAGLCGVPLPPGTVDGVDLAPALRGRVAPELVAFAHTKVLDDRLMEEFADLAVVRDLYPSKDPGLMWVSARAGDRFTRLRNRGNGTFVTEAFDLAADPFALRALAPTEVEEASLAAYKQRLIDAYTGERGVDAESIEADLRALGYVR